MQTPLFLARLHDQFMGLRQDQAGQRCMPARRVVWQDVMANDHDARAREPPDQAGQNQPCRSPEDGPPL